MKVSPPHFKIYLYIFSIVGLFENGDVGHIVNRMSSQNPSPATAIITAPTTIIEATNTSSGIQNNDPFLPTHAVEKSSPISMPSSAANSELHSYNSKQVPEAYDNDDAGEEDSLLRI